MVFKSYCRGAYLILAGINGFHILEFIVTVYPTAGVHFHDELILFQSPFDEWF
jgi:hypothetical protein